jgi:hypothetical protein
MKEHFMKKKTKQLKTATAAPEASGPNRNGKWLAVRKEAGRKIDPETQRAQREKQLSRRFITMIKFLYDWLDSGKSVEEFLIPWDIDAVGGELPEGLEGFPEFLRETLEYIKEMREEGADRNAVIAHFRETTVRNAERLADDDVG